MREEFWSWTTIVEFVRHRNATREVDIALQQEVWAAALQEVQKGCQARPISTD